MKNTTPMFPGFHLQTLRRKPRSAQQKLAERLSLLKQKSFKQIGEVFEKFIPCSLLKPEQAGAMSHRRLFSKENTFWAFFSQVLDADGGCKDILLPPCLIPRNILRKSLLNCISSGGMSNCFSATSRQPWTWTSCAAVHRRWSVKKS
jgi:hypothetical protein